MPKLVEALEREILGKNLHELRWWHEAYAYRIASDSMREPKCREIWERVGHALYAKSN